MKVHAERGAMTPNGQQQSLAQPWGGGYVDLAADFGDHRYAWADCYLQAGHRLYLQAGHCMLLVMVVPDRPARVLAASVSAPIAAGRPVAVT